MAKKKIEAMGLDELVRRANELLPRYLPVEVDDARMREEVNPRLVRHLTSLGLLDEAGREGREARYEERHLLQLLVARRLRAKGFTTAAIADVAAGQSDEQLEKLLVGDSHLTLQISSTAMPEKAEKNEALDYMKKLARRSSSAGAARASPEYATPINETSTYRRVAVRPGLEIHVADEFQLPSSPHERDALLQEVLQLLKTATPTQRRARRK